MQNQYIYIINLFEKWEIPIKNMIGFASDNASVMVGNKGGVRKLLQKDIPNLYVIGCISHSLHLCSSAAARKLPANIENLARNIYLFFAHSTKRQLEFKELQELFSTKTHKIVKTSTTRCLALEQVVNRIIEQWKVLEHYLTNKNQL